MLKAIEIEGGQPCSSLYPLAASWQQVASLRAPRRAVAHAAACTFLLAGHMTAWRWPAPKTPGFKSFREHAFIGPLGPLTAVVGPNGVGKSVVGEAIAFALGGNKKMLRAKALSALANNERRAAGNSMAQVAKGVHATVNNGVVAFALHVLCTLREFACSDSSCPGPIALLPACR